MLQRQAIATSLLAEAATAKVSRVACTDALLAGLMIDFALAKKRVKRIKSSMTAGLFRLFRFLRRS
jgi:hypothetical protein